MGGIAAGNRFHLKDETGRVLHKTGNLVTLNKLDLHYKKLGQKITMWDSKSNSEAFIPDSIKKGERKVTLPQAEVDFQIFPDFVMMRVSDGPWCTLREDDAKVFRMVSNRLSALALAKQILEK
jgi:hypothetical protein